MCKFCVDKGLMTQADLDAMVASGDRTVVPLLELEPGEFAEVNAQMVQDAIEAGEDPFIAGLLGALAADAYKQSVQPRMN